MEYRYTPEGVCSMQIIFDIEGNVVKKLKIIGGCPGNTVGVSKLAENRTIDELISILKGIPCGNKGTSCPDQVAEALEEYKENKALIAKERNSLERQLAELEENTPDKILDDPTPKMLDRVSSVHDILVSDSYSLVQKNEALKQIIDKIVYDRESDTLKIHFFLYHS